MSKISKILVITAGLSVFVWPLDLRAQSSSKVAVLSLSDSGVGEQSAKKISVALRREVKSLVGTRLKNRRVGQVCELQSLVRCASAQGKELGADLVLAGTVAALADAQLIDLRLIDVASKTEMSRLQSPLSGDLQKDRIILRELAVRLLLPENYRGQLLISSVAKGDKLVVDGAEQSVKAGAPISLSVGSHVVELLRAGETISSKVVKIAYGKSVVVDMLADTQVKTEAKIQTKTSQPKSGDQATQTHEIKAISGDQPGAVASGQAGLKSSDEQQAAAVNWPMWGSVAVATVGLATTVGLVSYYSFSLVPLYNEYAQPGWRELPFAQSGDPIFAYDYYQGLMFKTQLGIAAASLVTLASGAAAVYFGVSAEQVEQRPAAQ